MATTRGGRRQGPRSTAQAAIPPARARTRCCRQSLPSPLANRPVPMDSARKGAIERPRRMAKCESGDEKERGESAEDGQEALDEEVDERVAKRAREQRNQHPEAVLLPIVRRPAIETDQRRQQRVGVLIAMEGPEIDP